MKTWTRKSKVNLYKTSQDFHEARAKEFGLLKEGAKTEKPKEEGYTGCTCELLYTSEEMCEEYIATEAGYTFSGAYLECKLSCPHGEFEISLTEGGAERHFVGNDHFIVDCATDIFKALKDNKDNPTRHAWLDMAADIWGFFQPHMMHYWTLHNCNSNWTLEAKRVKQ